MTKVEPSLEDYKQVMLIAVAQENQRMEAMQDELAMKAKGLTVMTDNNIESLQLTEGPGELKLDQDAHRQDRGQEQGGAPPAD